jgi:hypothetical protein
VRRAMISSKRNSESRQPSTCPVCEELRARQSSRLAQYIQSECISNVILGITADLAVIPSVGALTPEHVLVVSRDHRLSILASEALRAQTEELLTRILNRLGRPGQVLFAFEHGARSELPEKRKCTTLHAHLHVIPLDPQPAEAVLLRVPYSSHSKGDPWTFVKTLGEGEEFVCSFLWSDRGYTNCGGTQNYLPSQHLRRVVAESLGLNQWDWRKMPRPPAGWRVHEWAQINLPVQRS